MRDYRDPPSSDAPSGDSKVRRAYPEGASDEGGSL